MKEKLFSTICEIPIFIKGNLLVMKIGEKDFQYPFRGSPDFLKYRAWRTIQKHLFGKSNSEIDDTAYIATLTKNV